MPEYVIEVQTSRGIKKFPAQSYPDGVKKADAFAEKRGVTAVYVKHLGRIVYSVELPSRMASDTQLRSDLIRLAHAQPHLRRHVLPLLQQASTDGSGDRDQ